MTDVCTCVYHLPLPWIPWSLLLVWLVHWAVPRRARWSTSTMTSAQTWSWWRSVSRYPSSVSVCLTLTCAVSLSESLPHWSVSSSIILIVCLCCCLLHVLVCPVIIITESAYTYPSFLLCIPCCPGQWWWWLYLGSCCPGVSDMCVNTLHTHATTHTYTICTCVSLL